MRPWRVPPVGPGTAQEPAPLGELAVEGVGVDLGGRAVVNDVSFTCAAGTTTGIVGPNGSGKSTLCRAVYRALRPTRGHVRCDGADVHTALGSRAAARRIAALLQDGGHDPGSTVADAVLVGRTPHFGALGRATTHDREVVAAALGRVGVEHLRHRPLGSLSGGERQRVLLARALAQQPAVLVLDEPTNHLDLAGQLDLLDLVAASGVSVLAVLHDLNLAAAVCDHLVVLDGGHVAAQGAAEDVLSRHLLTDVFRVRSHRGTNPLTGRLQLSFTSATALRPPSSPSDLTLHQIPSETS